MLPNDVRGGYQVDGDAEKIVPLVRLAARDGRRHHQGRSRPPIPRTSTASSRPPACPVLVRGGGTEDLRIVLRQIRRADARRARWAWSRAATSTSTPIPRASSSRADGADPCREHDRATKPGRSTPVADGGSYLLGLDAGNTVIKAVLFDADRPPARDACADRRRHRTSPRPAWSSARSANCGKTPRRRSAGCIDLGRHRPACDRRHRLRPATATGSICSTARASRLSASSRSIRGRPGSPPNSMPPPAMPRCRRSRCRRPGRRRRRRCSPGRTPPARTLRPQRRHAAVRQGFRRPSGSPAGASSEVSDMRGRRAFVACPTAVYDAELMALYGLEDAWHLLPEAAHADRRVVGTRDAGGRGGDRARGRHARRRRLSSTSSPRRSARAPSAPGRRRSSWGAGRSTRCSHRRRHRARRAACSWSPPMAPSCSPTWRTARPRPPISNGMCARWWSAACIATTRSASSTRPSAASPSPMTIRCFHPFLYGGRLGAHQRGGFVGLAGWHGEGTCSARCSRASCSSTGAISRCSARRASRSRSASLSGGGARSPHWPQMFADGLGVPVTVAEATETGALGAAIAAAVGAGLHADEAACRQGDDAAGPNLRARSHLAPHYDRALRHLDAPDHGARPDLARSWRQRDTGA